MEPTPKSTNGKDKGWAGRALEKIAGAIQFIIKNRLDLIAIFFLHLLAFIVTTRLKEPLTALWEICSAPLN